MDPYFLYQYGSQLETGSARFSDPGSFFVYIVFVGAVIMVSFLQSYCVPLSRLFVLGHFALDSTLHPEYLPAQPFLAEAVPGIGEDYRCTSHESSFA